MVILLIYLAVGLYQQFCVRFLESKGISDYLFDKVEDAIIESYLKHKYK